MIFLLNAILAVVLVLSGILFSAMRKVGAEAIAGLGSDELTVGEQQVAGGHRMWSNLSVVLMVLVVASFVLINI